VLLARREQIEHWLRQDRLLLTKIHELLEREGLLVPYSSLHRFAQKWCDFGKSSLVTVVVRFAPFHCTVDPARKLLPLTVSPKSGPPAVALLGLSVLAWIRPKMKTWFVDAATNSLGSESNTLPMVTNEPKPTPLGDGMACRSKTPG
jgi:hypothetical protein